MTCNLYIIAGDYARQAAKAPPARSALRALTPRRPRSPGLVASVISDGEGQRLQPATIQVFSQGRPPTAPVTLPNAGVPNRATAADPAGRLLNSVPNVEELDREHAASQLLVIDHVDHVVLGDPGH